MTETNSVVQLAPSAETRSTQLTPACAAAKTFLECLNTRDARRIRGLLADAVQMVGPDGKIHTDPDSFEEIERQGFANMDRPWRFELVNLLPFGSHGCLMEFTVSNDPAVPLQAGAVDRFEVDDAGKIVRFVPYMAASWVHNAVANITKHQQG